MTSNRIEGGADVGADVGVCGGGDVTVRQTPARAMESPGAGEWAHEAGSMVMARPAGVCWTEATVATVWTRPVNMV